MENIKTSKNNSKLSSNIAGAGGGTLLLLLAKNLPESNEYKSWLIIIAPTITVGLAAFWKWISKEFELYLRKRTVKKLKEVLRRDANKVIQNPDIPEEMKKDIRLKLAAFEKQNIDSLTKTILSIKIE
jgi:hypothetical protein